MKKIDEINKPDSTWNKIPDDEMVFILRAKDYSAPNTIMAWIMKNMENAPDAKLREAFECALLMQKEENRKIPD